MTPVYCPEGYTCSMYKAWTAGEYLLFFGGFAIIVIIGLLILWRVTR